jgi:(1->4)-alpha-D-glucan 1-alpha-D-glucosylmutase
MAPLERQNQIGTWIRGWTDGRIKLLVTAAGLRLRRDLPRVFLGGEYMPLATDVAVSAGAVGFARMAAGDSGRDAVIFLAPRLCSRLVSSDRPLPLGGECWKTSRVLLPPALRDRAFRDAMTGAELRPASAGESAWIFLGEAFQTLPVAILRAL